MSETPVIRTEGLTKRYGRARGIEDVSLEVRPGEVFGFLGPNGAGKTTTIRILMDLIRPTSGRAQLFGLDVRAFGPEARGRVGYLPGELELYERMTGEEHVEFLANLRGGHNPAAVRTLAERLGADLTRRISQLSKGNKQKVGLIQAMASAPELLVLDEPTSGLDPLVQREVHELIREAAAAGRTIFLSSHILPEVETLCDRVGIIRAGTLMTVAHMAELKERALRRVELHFAEPVAAAAFERLPGVREVVVHESVLHCAVVGSVDAVVKEAARHTVLNVISHEPSLEEIFLTYYEGGTPPAP